MFQAGYTELMKEVRIEFPHRKEVPLVHSEEALATAQLKLLKDYVHVHAEDICPHREDHRVEPDWYDAVICPVIKLFRDWHRPSQHIRYFADHDVFLKLLNWAELIRSMNVVSNFQARVQNGNAPPPPYSGLHQKFMLTTKRFDEEKKSRKTSRSSVLKCEKVAQDAYRIARSTHQNSY
jgi:hypothetical protein